jgi:transcriptional regulator with XRE-family HTH domain
MKIVDEEDLKIRLERGKNLKNIRIKSGYSREKLEELTNIKNLYQKEKGIRPLTNRDIRIISQKIGCLESDLKGNTEIYKNYSDASFKIVNKIDILQIVGKELSEINNSNNAIESYVIDEKFLKSSTGSENILILKCCNNFMYPLIEQNDDVFIDLNVKKFFNNGIFLIKDIGGGYVLKRVFKKEIHKDVITMNYINTSQLFQETEVDEKYFNNNVVGILVYLGKKYRLF